MILGCSPHQKRLEKAESELLCLKTRTLAAMAEFCYDEWENSLSDYPNKNESNEFLTQLKQGFVIHRPSTKPTFVQRNMPTDTLGRATLTEMLVSDVKAGIKLGPFLEAPFSDFHWSPIGVHPKEFDPRTGEILKYRPIHDLSAPRGKNSVSVNSEISPSISAVSYVKFTEVVRMIFLLGKGAFLWKVDLENAYRQLPVHPSAFKWLGCKWMGRFFVDTRLPLGLAPSCGIFTWFADFLLWILVSKNPPLFFVSTDLFKAVNHYLDDFFGGHPDFERALSQYNLFILTCERLGVKRSLIKSFPPSKTMLILGFLYDTENQTVSRDPAKALDLIRLIKIALSKRKILLSELESIVGKLRAASFVIFGSVAFVRRMEDSVRRVVSVYQKKHGSSRFPNGLKYHVTLSAFMKQDLLWCLDALQHHNGVPFSFVLSDPRVGDAFLFTDAATSAGLGGWSILTGKWFSVALPHELVRKKPQIDFLELLAVVLGFCVWWKDFLHHSVSVFTDNKVVFHWLVSKSVCLDSPESMRLMRILCGLCSRVGIKFWSNWISTEENCVADGLSRLFRPSPTLQFVPLNLKLTPVPFRQSGCRVDSILNILISNLCFSSVIDFVCD